MLATKGEGAPRCVDSGDALECVGWEARYTFNKPTDSQRQVLYYGRRSLGEVVPDDVWPGMFRMRWADGSVSDMTNLSRAVDAAAAIAERGPPARNRRRFAWKMERSKTPIEGPPVRQSARAAPEAFATVQATSEGAP
jgi:hypothetical protein